jgi:hypothetical protein
VMQPKEGGGGPRLECPSQTASADGARGVNRRRRATVAQVVAIATICPSPGTQSTRPRPSSPRVLVPSSYALHVPKKSIATVVDCAEVYHPGSVPLL